MGCCRGCCKRLRVSCQRRCRLYNWSGTAYRWWILCTVTSRKNESSATEFLCQVGALNVAYELHGGWFPKSLSSGSQTGLSMAPNSAPCRLRKEGLFTDRLKDLGSLCGALVTVNPGRAIEEGSLHDMDHHTTMQVVGSPPSDLALTTQTKWRESSVRIMTAELCAPALHAPLIPALPIVGLADGMFSCCCPGLTSTGCRFYFRCQVRHSYALSVLGHGRGAQCGASHDRNFPKLRRHEVYRCTSTNIHPHTRSAALISDTTTYWVATDRCAVCSGNGPRHTSTQCTIRVDNAPSHLTHQRRYRIVERCSNRASCATVPLEALRPSLFRAKVDEYPTISVEFAAKAVSICDPACRFISGITSVPHASRTERWQCAESDPTHGEPKLPISASSFKNSGLEVRMGERIACR